MAYKSVINIEKDKKKRQKILNDLKNSRTKTSYNSTSGAQGQATATTSRATTRTSSTQRTSSGTSMRERVANNNKGKSYYIGRGYQDRGATKTYTYKRSDDPDELTRLRQQAAQEEQGEYYKRQADNPDYGNTKAGKEQQSRIRAYQNAPKGRTVTTTGYRDEDWESKDASLSRDASLNRYRGSLNYTVRQAEKSNDDWKEWQRSLNGITSENPDDYNSKVAKGKKNNPLRQNSYGVDEQTLEYFDFLYGSGHAREARQGIDILKRSDKLRGDIDTKVGEYQNAALKSNQNIANNYKNEASKIQKRIDDIRDGKIQVSDPWGEIAALDDQRAEYEAKGREMQGYADLDKNIISTKVAMDKDPDAQKKIEEGKKKDTFLPGNANENVIQRVLDNSIGMQVLGQTGLFDDLSLKNVVNTMSEEERNMYYYKLSQSEDEAMEYLRTLYNTSIDKDGNLAGGLSNRYVEAVNSVPGMNEFNSVFGYVHSFGAGVQNAGVGIKDAFARMGGDESVHLEGLTQKLYQDNVEKGRVNKVAGDVIFNIGNMMPAIAVSIATGGMGSAPVVSAISTSLSVGSKTGSAISAALAATTTGLGAFGNTYQQARREGFESDEATAYALLNGISEASLQYVLSGIGQMAGGFTTKTLSENAVKAIGQAVKNPVAKYVIGQIVGQSINSLGEFTEEYLQEILDPVFRNWALGESNEFQAFTPEALYSGILGALSAGLMNTVEVRGNIAQYTRNGQIYRENVIDLINQALTFSNDEEARKTAQYLQEKIKNGGQVTDMEAGLLVKQTDDALALENEIRQYQYGDADWETLSDRARATLVTPANAEYLAREFGFNVNENMTPDEMRAAVDDAVQETRASENRRSFSELVNDQMAAAQTDEDRAKIQTNAQQNQELFSDTEEATGKRIEVADLGRGVNGYTTADKIVINSEIANTEDGARFALAHELTHGTELSRHYGALREAAMRFYGDNWESEVEKIMKRYQKINPGFSRQQAETEVVADFVGNHVFTDIESMKQFIRDHKTTARRIFSWLKNKLSNTSGQENKALRDAYNAFERAFNEIDRSLEGRRAAMQYQYDLATGAQYSLTEDPAEHFGTTTDWSVTGYLTPDGTQLDFSGRHWDGGQDTGGRFVDHRDISEIMPDNVDGADAMNEFMAQGNIRIMPETNGIDLSVMPTDAQFRSLADYIRQSSGDVMLDVSDEDGRTMFSKDYPMGTNPSTVLNDIRNYFNENVQPEDALYSRGEDEQSLRSLSERPLESIRQYSLNARTTQYVQDYGDFDAKQKEDSRNTYEAVIQLSNIHKRLVDLHKAESGIKRVALSVHEINEVLHAHPEIWDELIAIRDQFSALGIHSDFVTDRNENGTRLLQGEEVPGGVVGLPIEYRMNEDGTPTFKRFWRTLPQIFMDNMDSTTKERLRAIYVQATEQAYAANRGEYMPDIMTVENFPNLKDYEKALKKFQKESKYVGGELSASTLSNRMKKERLQAPVRKAEKTVMALNLNSACPMFTVGNHGCYLDACYLTQMGKGAMGVNLFDSAFYSGEVLQLKDSDIKIMNAMGGLRLNGVGDTTSGNAQQMVDIIKHANMRGLEIKIITKQMETLNVLKMAHDQGIDVSNVTVQPSMDYLWTPVALDDVFGSGIRGDIPGVENKASTGIGATLKKWNEASESEREDMVQQFEMGYEHFFGRAVMYKDGVLYRKYGFSSDQIRSMMKEFDYVKITPRYVVCTAQEIAETALNRNGQIVNQGEVIQTLMHGVVPDECISEYGGEVLNFGSARHVIEKNANGEWDFYGVKKNAKTGKDERINSAPHQKVLDYVRENYTPEEQNKIWSTLKRSACCQNNDFKDACAGCQSLCAGGCGLCSIKPNTGADTTGRQFSLSDDGSDNVSDTTEEVSEDRRILDNAAEAYGTIKPGENPVREANMPKRTSENRFVSKFARTLYEAGATTDEMIPALDSGIAAEDFSYERISNKKLAKGAEDTIKIDGLDSARRQWDGVAERTDAATPQDIALGQYIYNEYVKAGDYDNAIQVAIDLARKATTAGQTVQAFRLLKKITPDGQLYALEKLANDYNKQLSQRKIKGFSGIEIDENLAKRLLEAKTKEEINTAREAIMQNIADQVPATWVDKLNAWRYMSMLFNPRTHIRNIVGNAMFAPVRGLKDLIGAGLESAVQKAGGIKQTERTKTVVNPFDKANKPLFDKAREAFKEDEDIIRGEDKYGKNELDRRRRIFKSRVLNWIDKFNSAALEKEDVIFMKKAYIGSYVKAMKARGLTPETMTSAQENEISAYAIREAQKATYRDANALAQALNKFKRSNKFAHLLGEGLFPFTKTPLNILKRGVEYSPLGIIKGVYQAYNSVKNGNYTAAEAIDSMASGMAGTGILALGMFLASQGLIKGGSGDDDEAALDSLQGGQEYSLVIGDKSYTLDWAAPVALPLFIGVEIFNTMNNESSGEANFSRIVDSVTKISDPLFNLSMLSSLNSAIDAIKYSEGSPLTEIGINVVTSYAGQYVPTLLGQFARIIDENQRKTFYGKDSKMPKAVDSLWQGAVKKIPFLSMIMQPSVDRWGREKKTENITERTLENLVSPGYYSEKSSDNVDIEIDRLYARTGEAGVIPANPEKSIKWTNYDTKETGEMMLTAEEYTKYAKRLGTLSYDGVQKLINSKAYQELNDRDKALAVQEIYDYAKQVAKNEITGGKYQIRDWVQLMKENENVLGDYAVYKTKLSGKDLDTAEKREVLIGMKLPDEVREQIYRASFSESDIKTLDEALSSGARFDQYLNMRIAMDKIDASDSETKNVDKKEWLVNNISSEKSLKALYKTFFETENTNERNTIEYASSQGVNVEHFINREIQKTTEESDYEGTTQDYVYQIVDGVAQVITDEKGKAVYGSKMKKALDDMLSSGYTEDDLTYFYQREYGSDDMFVWAKQSGITAKQYMQFRDDTLQLTADKDENGKSISGTKKAKVFDAINAMRLSAVKKLILFSKSYKLSKDQYQQIIDYVQGLKDLSDEEKLMVLQGLKIEVIDGVPYPQKAS